MLSTEMIFNSIPNHYLEVSTAEFILARILVTNVIKLKSSDTHIGYHLICKVVYIYIYVSKIVVHGE